MIELFAPELTLLVTVIALVLSEVTNYGEKKLAAYVGLLGLFSALAQVLVGFSGLETSLEINLWFDQYSVFFKGYFILLAALVVTMAHLTYEASQRLSGEFYMFVVTATLGLCLISSANDLLFLFLGFQILNVVCFFLCGYRSEYALSSEAAIKYLIFSVISSGFFLYSMAILYAQTGTLRLDGISSALLMEPLSYNSNLVVFCFLLFSFSFYLAAFPFFLWLSDVIEGAPTPSALFLCLAVPGAGIAAAFRTFNTIFEYNASAILNGIPWTWIVAICAGITMLVGAFMALLQSNIKRVMAGLVISHSGFIMAALAIPSSVEGHAAILFNQVVMLLSLVGLFGVLAVFYERLKSDDLSRYKGALHSSFFESLMLILFLACFVGLPPFPGFFGKFSMVNAVVQSGWYGLALVEVIALVITMGAFVRVAQTLVQPLSEKSENESSELAHRLFLVGLIIPIALLTWFTEPLLEWSRAALFH